MHSLDKIGLAAALLMLGACSDLGDIRTGSVRLTEARSAGAAPATSGRAALASLPVEAGEVISVSENETEKGFVQTVTLATDGAVTGANTIRIEGVPRGAAVTKRLAVETIEAELAEVLADADMRVLPQPVESLDGPIGVALGTTPGGVRCAYAWRVSNTGENEIGFSRLLTLREKALSVRVRLCRPGATDAALLAQIQGLRVASTGQKSSPRRPVTVGADALESAGGVSFVVPVASRPREATAPIADRPAAPMTQARAEKPKPAKEAVHEPAKRAAPTAAAAPSISAPAIPLPSGG